VLTQSNDAQLRVTFVIIYQSHKTGESFHVHVAGSGPVLMLDKPAILGMNEVRWHAPSPR
jgi:hypothetical protein